LKIITRRKNKATEINVSLIKLSCNPSTDNNQVRKYFFVIEKKNKLFRILIFFQVLNLKSLLRQQILLKHTLARLQAVCKEKKYDETGKSMKCHPIMAIYFYGVAS
jgi:hypothetical protein